MDVYHGISSPNSWFWTICTFGKWTIGSPWVRLAGWPTDLGEGHPGRTGRLRGSNLNLSVRWLPAADTSSDQQREDGGYRVGMVNGWKMNGGFTYSHHPMIWKGKWIWTRPPWLCSMLIFRGVFINSSRKLGSDWRWVDGRGTYLKWMELEMLKIPHFQLSSTSALIEQDFSGFVFRLHPSTCEDWNGLVATGRRCPGGSAKGYDASHRRQTAEFPILTTGKDGASAVLVEVRCAKKVLTSTPLIVMETSWIDLGFFLKRIAPTQYWHWIQQFSQPFNTQTNS